MQAKVYPFLIHSGKLQLSSQKATSLISRSNSFNHTRPQETRGKHLFHGTVALNSMKIDECRSVPGPEDELYFMITQATDMHTDMRSVLRRKGGKKDPSLPTHAAKGIILGHRFKQLL